MELVIQYWMGHQVHTFCEEDVLVTVLVRSAAPEGMTLCNVPRCPMKHASLFQLVESPCIVPCTLIKESYHDVENPDQLRVLAFSTLP